MINGAADDEKSLFRICNWSGRHEHIGFLPDRLSSLPWLNEGSTMRLLNLSQPVDFGFMFFVDDSPCDLRAA